MFDFNIVAPVDPSIIGINIDKGYGYHAVGYMLHGIDWFRGKKDINMSDVIVLKERLETLRDGLTEMIKVVSNKIGILEHETDEISALKIERLRKDYADMNATYDIYFDGIAIINKYIQHELEQKVETGKKGESKDEV